MMGESLNHVRSSSQGAEVIHVVGSSARVAIGREEEGALHCNRSRGDQRKVDCLKVPLNTVDRCIHPAGSIPGSGYALSRKDANSGGCVRVTWRGCRDGGRSEERRVGKEG